jgi:hypothetical protein
MMIDRESWHYKLQRMFHGESEGEAKNRCQYFWRVAVSMVGFGAVCLVAAPVAAVIYILIVYLGVVCIGMPLLGWRVRSYNPWQLIKLAPSDQWNPTRTLFIRIASFRVFPYQVVITASALWAAYTYSASPFGSVTPGRVIAASLLFIYVGALLLVGLCMLGWGIYIGVSRARRTETWHLIREYTRATKERVCPLIEYVGQAKDN